MTIKPLADRVLIKMEEAERDHKERDYPGRFCKGKAAGRGCHRSGPRRYGRWQGSCHECQGGRSRNYQSVRWHSGQDGRRGIHHRSPERHPCSG